MGSTMRFRLPRDSPSHAKDLRETVPLGHHGHTYLFAHKWPLGQGSHAFDSCYKISKLKIHGILKLAWQSHAQTNKGEEMNYPAHKTIRPLFMMLFALLLALVTAGSTLAQEKKVGQQNGVDNSKMGPYRALAQHIFSDFQKGDLAGAAEMARVLERVWDKAEDYGGDAALSKTNRQLFDEIDKAMDQFLTPIWEAKAKPPDPTKLRAAYNTYLEKLKLAD